jgi:hypothetical protein
MFRYLPIQTLEHVDQIFGTFNFFGKAEQWGYLDIFRTLTENFVPVNFHYNNKACFTG